MTVDSSSIELGAGATEPLVLGNALLQAFNAHTHPSSAGPTGIPVVPLTAAVLAKKARTA